MMRRALAGALLLFLAGACARIAPPGGGPQDRDAPQILAQQPDSGALRVSADQPLRIAFSEPMNQSAVRDWLLIAPWPGKLDLRWDGDTLTCEPSTGWSPETTYAVLLGVGAADRHGNPLASALLFAFATGDSLADGRIRGELHTASLRRGAVPLFLFPWPDTLTPPVQAEVAYRPDPRQALRLAQSREDGSYEMPFVPRGAPFLLAALFDRNGNRAFDEGQDLWGFSEEPLICPDTSLAPVEGDVYLVYADEPGSIAGEVSDSTCLGYRPPRAYQAQIDTLQMILDGDLDPSGFAIAEGESLPAAQLSTAERESLLTRVSGLQGELLLAAAESLRCDGPIWVGAIADGDTLVAGESRSRGAFEIEELPPGDYRLTAFRDANGNGARDGGERRGAFPYPVEVRPGRAVSGVAWSITTADSAGHEDW